MRRGPGGVGAINKHRLAKAKYAEKGTEIADIQLSQMGKQLDSFKNYLEDFASKHKSDIKKNPEFRGHFQKMCARIGVDPLASSKGFWAELLGVGDFYYELGVQIVEICMAMRPKNGGLMTLDSLHKAILKSSKARQDVTEDDLERAIKKLHALGSGFQVIVAGNRRLVQSVPGELSMDHTDALKLAQGKGFTSVTALKRDLGWDEERACRALNHLVHEELAWVDDQEGTERHFWFPTLFPDPLNES
ncbi:vacuolar-sorting protein SNF8 isoform X1 [Nematostella vectensis]|uniref:vacuolar-sorting protein SNF8 isoform X1 n=1 Tax=Nematostella vectensis TaxID=45351 RepID=UPI00207763A7|nr:vacuolar-sorting protein SNF8 isoform X1 [Nematostella vectensis]